jgi:hypothetical protein
MGAVGGGIWHFSKGMYHSPRGLSSRFAGGVSVRARSLARRRAAMGCRLQRGFGAATAGRCAAACTCPRPSVAEKPSLQTMRFEAPRLGGSFAVWGGLFSAFDCTLVAVRKKARADAARATAAPQPSRTRRATARAATLTRHAARRRTRGTQSAPARSPADSCRCAPPAAHCALRCPPHTRTPRSCATAWRRQAAPPPSEACCWLASRASGS